jgi:hypothetical protein
VLGPDSETHGDLAFVLTVTGTNFSTRAVINFNGAAQTTNQVTQLTATFAATDIDSAGTMPVTVTNPATAGTGTYGSGGTWLTLQLR